MEEIIQTTEFELQNTAVTLGKFDGLHRGHQKLLSAIKKKRKDGLTPVVFTFGTMPAQLLSGKNKDLILTSVEKRFQLMKMGLDVFIEYPLDEKMLLMEPEDFIREILVDKLHAKYIVAGSDFRFGHNRRGDGDMLKQYGKQFGFQTDIIDKEQYEGHDISSTYIRSEIENGNMEKIRDMLGIPFSVLGIVQHGNKLGRTWGIPTANLIPDTDKLLPPNGVYTSKTLIGEKKWEGITNIGYKPTVGGELKKGIETYLFDYDGDLYGKEILVYLHHFVRQEKRFDSLESLKAQMQHDIQTGKEYFANQVRE